MASLVSTEWLHQKMSSPEWKDGYRLLDGTWDVPMAKRNCMEEHKNCRIPGAKHFSLLECKNKEATLPYTMPTLEQFQDYVNGLGISNNHHVVIYDNSERFGLFSAPRVWWFFNLFGHENVSIVDGGLPKWKKDGYPTTSGEYSADEKTEDSCSNFIAKLNESIAVDLAFMKSNYEEKGTVQVVDARSQGRFRGIEPEPRPDIPSGHIPYSTSVPFFTNLDSEQKVVLPLAEIKKNFEAKNVDINKPMVASCGSGITACVLAFVVFLATEKRIPVFDDSWFGWQLNTSDDMQIREAAQ